MVCELPEPTGSWVLTTLLACPTVKAAMEIGATRRIATATIEWGDNLFAAGVLVLIVPG